MAAFFVCKNNQDSMRNERLLLPPVTFGVVADLQYCDAPPFKNRYFHHSIQKLKTAVTTFNELKADFVINLGDTIDRDWESFDEILPIFHDFKMPVYHVLGNHDYEVPEDKKAAVSRILNTRKYYDFSWPGWRFIVLDGNEISTFANAEGSENYLLARAMLEKMEKERKVNANFWNGAISDARLQWLEEKLATADANHEKMVIFCHYPIYPPDRHTLLNDTEVLELLKSHDCVKAWVCGHNHHGNYGMLHDIHFINVRGMVEGPCENESEEGVNTAFSLFRLENDVIFIQGFGNEISARLSTS